MSIEERLANRGATTHLEYPAVGMPDIFAQHTDSYRSDRVGRVRM